MYVDKGVETLPFLRNQSKNNPTWFDQFCWGCPVLTWTYENLMTVRVEGPEPIIWTPHDPTSLPQKNYHCLSLPPCADTNPIKISAVLDGILHFMTAHVVDTTTNVLGYMKRCLTTAGSRQHGPVAYMFHPANVRAFQGI